ncbi:MAG: hypothetical protein N3H31_06925 [Candidatus Nezhaarchaeota archaeon]|nr:hypothetical protein [Candidatus Nezhaarchaeota archaeon]
MNYLRCAGVIREALKRMDLIPDLFISERRTFLLCKKLLLKLNKPLLLLQDALKYLFIEQLVKASSLKIRDLLIVPPARLYYLLSTAASDLSIAVSRDIELRLKNPLMRNKVYTVRPTFMLVSSSHSLETEKLTVDELPNELVIYSGPLTILRYLASKTPAINYVVTGPSAYYAKHMGLGDFRNVHLLHDVSDVLLSKLHEKAVIALIIRQVMTGISMTIVQELYFGKPVLVNSVAIQGLEELSGLGVAEVEDNLPKLPLHLREMLRNEDRLKDAGAGALRFFEEHLSPTAYAKNVRSVLRLTGKRR